MAMGVARRRAVTRRARRGGRGRGPVSDINVTPLVDVALVLLIIFMVAAPLLTTGVPLQLPETSADALPTPEEAPLTVQIDAQGVIYIQDEPAPSANLTALLTAIAQERSQDQVYLRADASLDYGRVMSVMGALKSAGFRSVSLVTDPLPAEGETR